MLSRILSSISKRFSKRIPNKMRTGTCKLNFKQRKVNGIINSMDDGNLVSIVRQLTEVIKNEISPQIKDICTDIIILVKSRVNDQSVVEKCLDNLPRYRKQLVAQDYSSEKTGKSISFSKEPQPRSKKSKANISYNSTKEMNLSVNKEEKPKFRAESKSIDKNNNLNNTLQEKLKNKVKGNIYIIKKI